MMRDQDYEPRSKRSRRNVALKIGVWVLLVFFVITSLGVVLILK